MLVAKVEESDPSVPLPLALALKLALLNTTPAVPLGPNPKVGVGLGTKAVKLFITVAKAGKGKLLKIVVVARTTVLLPFVIVVELSEDEEGPESEVGAGLEGIEGNWDTIDWIPGEVSDTVIFPFVVVPVLESVVLVVVAGGGASVVVVAAGLGTTEVELFSALVNMMTEILGKVVTDWTIVIDGIPLASTEVKVITGIVAVGPGINEVSPTIVAEPITIEGSGKGTGNGVSDTVTTEVVLDILVEFEIEGAGVIIGAGIVSTVVAEIKLLDTTLLLGTTIAGLGNKLCKTPTILWASVAIESLAAWAAGSALPPEVELELEEEVKIPDAIESEVEDCDEVEAGTITVAFWGEEEGDGEGFESEIVIVESTTGVTDDDDEVGDSVEEDDAPTTVELSAAGVDFELEVEFVELPIVVLFELFPFFSPWPSLSLWPSVSGELAAGDDLVELEGSTTEEEGEEVETTVEFTELEVSFEFEVIVAFLTADTSLWAKCEVVANRIGIRKSKNVSIFSSQ